jgi:hypothetical protein
MVASAIEREAPTPTAPRPYRASWLDVLFGAITALPGPTWLAYLVLLIPSVVLSNSMLWSSGIRPWGEIDPTQTFWGVLTLATFAAIHHLRNEAGRAFDRFRPALGDGVADAEVARYELTVMPARPILLITVVSVALTILYYVVDPVASQVTGLSAAGLAIRTISESATTAAVLGLVYQAVRQTRRVNRLHAAAENVDPFRPLPLYAFSRLTAQTGTVLVLFNSVGVALNPASVSSEASFALYLPWLVGFAIVAVGFFLVPLLGMHRRLEDIKDSLESASGARLRSLLGELNEAIDRRDSDGVEALDRTISALRHEREILRALPTWPWSATTVRGFASALLLPLALFLVQRFLSQVL